MNAWGQVFNFVQEKSPEFKENIFAYFEKYYPDDLYLLNDVETNTPDHYSILYRIIARLMSPRLCDLQVKCLNLFYRFSLKDYDASFKEIELGKRQYLIREDYIDELAPLFGDLVSMTFHENALDDCLNYLIQNKANLPVEFLITYLDQLSVIVAEQGKLNEYVDKLNELNEFIANKLGIIQFSNKEKAGTVLIFIKVINWKNNELLYHAPSFILKNWLDLLVLFFDNILVCYELDLNLVLPFYRGTLFNSAVPEAYHSSVSFHAFPQNISKDELKNRLIKLGVGENTPFLIMAGGQYVASRIQLKKSFFFPMIQNKLTHLARYQFYYPQIGFKKFADKNRLNEPIQFIPCSENFAERSNLIQKTMPLDYFNQRHLNGENKARISLVFVGWGLAAEIEAYSDEFIQFLTKLSEFKALDVYLIGVSDQEFNLLKKPELDSISILNIPVSNHLVDDFKKLGIDFYINPPRAGGGGGAFLAFQMGIPVLTYPIGDVGSFMDKVYYMNEPADFIEFIKTFWENEDFRKTISECHRAFLETKTLSKTETMQLFLKYIRAE